MKHSCGLKMIDVDSENVQNVMVFFFFRISLVEDRKITNLVNPNGWCYCCSSNYF